MERMSRDTVYNDNGSWFTSDTLVHIRQYREVIAHDLVKLKPTLDPDGTGMLYWYISITGDTVALSRELSTFEYQIPKMTLPVRDSDTIQPNGNSHPSATAFVAHYPTHKQKATTSTDNAFHAAMFPVLVLITVAYLYRSAKSGVWTNLFRDLVA
jgi:hypothetical protein